MEKRIKAYLKLGDKIMYSEVRALRINQSQILEIEKYVDSCPNRLVNVKKFKRLLNASGISYSETESNANRKEL